MMGLYLADVIILVAGPIAFNNVSWKFFFVFIVMTFLNIIFVYFLCPETKGNSLEDINAKFGEEVAIHFYGATEAEKMEMEAAVMADEKADEKHDHSHLVDDVKDLATGVHVEDVSEKV